MKIKLKLQECKVKELNLELSCCCSLLILIVHCERESLQQVDYNKDNRKVSSMWLCMSTYLTNLQVKDICPAEVLHQTYCTAHNRPAVGGTKAMHSSTIQSWRSFINSPINSLRVCASKTKAFCVIPAIQCIVHTIIQISYKLSLHVGNYRKTTSLLPYILYMHTQGLLTVCRLIWTSWKQTSKEMGNKSLVQWSVEYSPL